MNKQNYPSVAVITLVYNRKKELSELLSSIENMVYPNFDLYVVDNGSNDNLEDVIEKYNKINISFLRNEENLGVGAGFNTGIKFALSKKEYEYVWLLDSDLTVEEKCLRKLVEVSENNTNIGISAPKIVNNENNDLIVALGTKLNFNDGHKIHLYSNTRNFNDHIIIDVDFVGDGISLIRAECIKSCGYYDERYFWLWEDTDYCLKLKKLGYRIVAVSDAIVYHPPGTEKRGPSVVAYYENRNSLLNFSKNSDNLLKRIYVLYNITRRIFRAAIFELFSKNYILFKLNLLSLYHYITSHWGEYKLPNHNYTPNKRDIKEFINSKNILIISSFAGPSKIEKLINILKVSIPDSRIYLLTQEDRKGLFQNINIKDTFTYDRVDSFSYLTYAKIFLKVFFKGFDLSLNPASETNSIFSLVSKRSLKWDNANEQFIETDNIYSIWKIPLILFFSELIALIISPVVFITSYRYK